MKKAPFVSIMIALVIAASLFMGCAPKTTIDDWKWKPGTDAVTYRSTAADDYSATFTVNLKIVGGNNTVLYDGTVTLTSPQMMASEFISAAINDKGLAQEGVDVGFITKIGDYENDTTTGTYWLFYVNGEMPNWGVNEFRLRNGDYVELVYEVYPS